MLRIVFDARAMPCWIASSKLVGDWALISVIFAMLMFGTFASKTRLARDPGAQSWHSAAVVGRHDGDRTRRAGGQLGADGRREHSFERVELARTGDQHQRVFLPRQADQLIGDHALADDPAQIGDAV